MTLTSPTPELLPCPFCGNKPILIDARPNQSPPFYVICKGKFGNHPCNAQLWPSDTPDKAIEIWNTRVAPPSVAAGIKSAEEWFEKINGRKPDSGKSAEAIEWIKKIQLDAKTAERARVEKLRSAMTTVITGDYEIIGKNDKCRHGKYGYECCTNCIDDYLQAALNEDNHGGDENAPKQ